MFLAWLKSSARSGASGWRSSEDECTCANACCNIAISPSLRRFLPICDRISRPSSRHVLKRCAGRYQRLAAHALLELLQDLSEMNGCPGMHVGQVDRFSLLGIDGQIDDLRACKLL